MGVTHAMSADPHRTTSARAETPQEHLESVAQPRADTAADKAGDQPHGRARYDAARQTNSHARRRRGDHRRSRGSTSAACRMTHVVSSRPAGDERTGPRAPEDGRPRQGTRQGEARASPRLRGAGASFAAQPGRTGSARTTRRWRRRRGRSPRMRSGDRSCEHPLGRCRWVSHRASMPSRSWEMTRMDSPARRRSSRTEMSRSREAMSSPAMGSSRMRTLGLRGEQPGQGDASHLPAGEVVDAARGQGGVKADEVHGLVRRFGRRPRGSTPSSRRADTAADARAVPGGGEDVGAHGGALELEARELHGEGDVADAAFHGAPRRGSRRPHVGIEQPGEDARQCRLTRPVVAGDEHGLAGVEDQADVAQDGLLPRGAEVVGVRDSVGPQVLGIDEGGFPTRARRPSGRGRAPRVMPSRALARGVPWGEREDRPGLVDGAAPSRATVGDDAPAVEW